VLLASEAHFPPLLAVVRILLTLTLSEGAKQIEGFGSGGGDGSTTDDWFGAASVACDVARAALCAFTGAGWGELRGALAHRNVYLAVADAGRLLKAELAAGWDGTLGSAGHGELPVGWKDDVGSDDLAGARHRAYIA
jgi:hypothetical protein